MSQFQRLVIFSTLFEVVSYTQKWRDAWVLSSIQKKMNIWASLGYLFLLLWHCLSSYSQTLKVLGLLNESQQTTTRPFDSGASIQGATLTWSILAHNDDIPFGPNRRGVLVVIVVLFGEEIKATTKLPKIPLADRIGPLLTAIQPFSSSRETSVEIWLWRCRWLCNLCRFRKMGKEIGFQ